MDEWQVFYIVMTGSVTLVTVTFAALVLVQAPPRTANRALAAFLLLIGGNQGLETLVAFGVASGLSLPNEPILTLKQLAYVLAAADPFVLYYFASVFPERNRLNHPLPVVVVGLGSAYFMAQANWAYLGSSTWAGHFALDAFTAVVYSVVFVRFAVLAARPTAGSVERLLLFAAAVAAIPVLPRAAYSMMRIFSLGTFLPNYASWIVLLVILAAAVAADRRGSLVNRTFTQASFLGASVSFLALLPVYLAPFPVMDAAVRPAHDFVGLNAPVRWLLFSLLVSIAVFRHDVLGLSLGARRRSARAAVVVALTVVVLALFTGLAVYVDLSVVTPSPVEVVLIVLVASLSVGFRSLIARAADALYGLPEAGGGRAAVVAYEGAVRQARREGRLLAVDPDLARLRRELGVDAATAEVVERAVRGEASAHLEVGGYVDDRYLVERFLGRGGSGQAFQARDLLLDRTVCLKEVLETQTVAGDRLLDEARAAARVRHGNVVAVHDVLPRTGRVILVSELLPASLEDVVRDRGGLSFESAVRIFDGVLAGLEAVHGAGVLHRDLKPSNVFVADDGTARIGDFGVSLFAEGATLAPGDGYFGGTVGFLAPEVLEGRPATAASDVFAVGRCMERTLSEEARRRLAPVVDRALARHPRQRFRSAAQMREALRQAARGDGA